MKKKSIKNKIVFADGGLNMILNFKAGNKQAGLGQAIGLASGAMDLGASMYGNLQTDTYNALRFNAGSLDSLQAQSGSYIPEPAHTENVAGNAMSGALKGAQAGMAFGPWGAGIGAVIGGAGEAITTLIGNNKEELAALAAKTQSLANMNNNAQNISNLMAKNKQAQYFSEGGPMGNGVTQFNNGGTHEENPNGGIPQGIGANGLPNLVEEGEVKYKDYIFSDRLKATKTTLDSVGLPNKFIGKSYGQIAKNLQKESAERPNDPISQRGLADMMQKLKDAQETTRAKRAPKNMQSYAPEQTPQIQMSPEEMQLQLMMAYGGNIFDGLSGLPLLTYQAPAQVPTEQTPLSGFDLLKRTNANTGPTPEQLVPAYTDKFAASNYIPKSIIYNEKNPAVDVSKSKKSVPNIFSNIDSSYLRYAPVIASGLQAFSDQAGWTNKADTTLADTVSNQGVKVQRLTDKMNYQPLDTRWAQNQAAAQQAATRQGILDTAGGNRATAMAGLVGADYVGGLQAGQLARQEAEYNQAQKQKVAEFNRATNQYNSEADKWEQATRMQNIIQGAQLKEQAIQQAAAVRSANMNNFLGNITGVGQEAMNRNMITSNPALYYTIDNSGNIKYKQSDLASYAKANNITIAEAEKRFKASAQTNPNYKNS